MRAIYAKEPLPEKIENGIMLCGPTTRDITVPSWRPAAFSWFDYFKFPGTLFIPEPRDGICNFTTYEEQVDWESEALEKAKVILFWIPRDLIKLPGFVSNVEFGMWAKSGKVVIGYPPNAPKMKIFKYHASKNNIPVASTLEETVQLAINHIPC